MLAPLIPARMKQRDDLPDIFVPPRRRRRFIQIAGLARQRQIVRGIAASGGTWLDMFDFKGEVKDALRGAAVFAPIFGPFCYIRVERIHDSPA